VIPVFMQSNYPSKQDVEAVYEDFPIVGTRVCGWQTYRILKEYRVLPYSVSPICCKEVPPWNPPSTF
jgi:hypothetical protein